MGATPEDASRGGAVFPTDELELRLSLGFKVALFVGAVFSLGLVLIRFWLRSRRWPRRVDRQGLALRNGARVSWSRLDRITGVLVLNHLRQPVAGRWRMSFGALEVELDPSNFDVGHEALALITRVTGRDYQTG